MKALAQFISFVFHPLLLTTYLTLLLCLFFPPMLMIAPERIWTVAAFIGLITFVLPALNLAFFRLMGNISSLSLRDRSERIMPFFFIAIIYILVAVLFYYKLPLSSNLVKLLMIIAAIVLVAACITIFYKVSIHSMAMWGGIGILLPLNKAISSGELLYPTVGLILIAGIVMWARLKLDAHVPREIFIGGLTGFFIGLAGVFILF